MVPVHGLIHVAAGFEEAIAVALGTTRFGFEEVVADVGAGDVDIGSNAFEKAGAGEEIVADQVVGGLDLAEGLHAVESAESHEQQESAEPGGEHQPAVSCHGSIVA